MRWGEGGFTLNLANQGSAESVDRSAAGGRGGAQGPLLESVAQGLQNTVQRALTVPTSCQSPSPVSKEIPPHEHMNSEQATRCRGSHHSQMLHITLVYERIWNPVWEILF